MQLPKITLITPSYNQAKFLEKTILSVINQKYENLEWLVFDGGSNDGSLEIIKKYSDYFTFWVSEKDNGQSAAINRGFKMASGEIVGWLNSDDTLYTNCFEEVAKAFLTFPDNDVVYGNFAYIDPEDNILRKKFLPSKISYSKLLYHSYLGQPAVFYKRELLEKIGFLDVELKFCMDWDFFLRMWKDSKKIHINEFLATYRLHRESKTSDEGSKRYTEDVKRIFNKNKIRKYSNKSINELYYKSYFIFSKFQRIYSVIRDNPVSYLRVYLLNNSFNIKNLAKFLRWRIRY